MSKQATSATTSAQAVFTGNTFATWVLAQCGNKDAQAVVRVEMVRAQAVVALKGNKTQWMQAAQAVAQGKRTTEKAFRAGFMAVGEISALFKPQDQTLTKEQKNEAIEAKADELVMVFESAYLAEIPAEKTKEQKDAAKADKVAARNKEIAETVEKEIAARGLKPATDGEILAAAIALIQGGKVGETLADEFRAALGFDAAKAQAFADGKAAAMAELTDKATGKTTAKATKQAVAA